MWLTSLMRITLDPCWNRVRIWPLLDQTNLKFAAVLSDRALYSNSWFCFVSCSTISIGFFEFCSIPISEGYIVLGNVDLSLSVLFFDCMMPISNASKSLISETRRCDRIWLNFFSRRPCFASASRSTPLMMMFELISSCSTEVPVSVCVLDSLTSWIWPLRLSISYFRCNSSVFFCSIKSLKFLEMHIAHIFIKSYKLILAAENTCKPVVCLSYSYTRGHLKMYCL